eukprot:GFUD01005543.1.p1 GENE.GFUD01005543.1~~GFUD01005543.1.p1  ORF type:complete len:543 (-),score=84.41 GFUD01005543.1:219-1847(-)
MKISTLLSIVFILLLEKFAVGCKKKAEPPPKPRCKLPLVSRQVTEAGGLLICSGHADPYYNVPKSYEDIHAAILAKGGVIENGTLVIKEELIVPKQDPESSECHLICLPGSVPSPDSSTSCSAGVWTQDPGTMLCTPSPCGVPVDPQHGQYSCLGNPSTCYLTCDPGYVTMSSTAITCQDDTWDVDPSSLHCEVAVALLIGGGGSTGVFFPEMCQTAEVFSPQDETCSSVVLPELLIGVIHHTSHLLNGEILLCGGAECGRTAEKIDAETSGRNIYDGAKPEQSCFKMLENNTWTLHSDLSKSEYRMYQLSAIQQDKLQIIAGLRKQEAPILELQEQSWVPGRKPSLPPTVYPTSLGRPCSVVTSPTTYLVIGGSSDQLSKGKMSSVLEFNSLTGEWRALPDLPVGRTDHACTLVTTKSGPGVMVAGGKNFIIQKMYPLESVFLLDLGTEVWYPAGNLNRAREQMGLVALGEKVLVLGSSPFSKDGFTTKNETVEEYVVPCPSLRECSPSQQGTWNLTERTILRRSSLSVLPVAASRFNCSG